MTALEFSKVRPEFLEIENDLIKKCLDNDVRYFDYLGSFVRFKISNYISLKQKLCKIMNLKFNNLHQVRAVLNTRDFGTKKSEIEKAKNELNLIRKEIFNWLDKTKDPYFFILNCVWEFGAYFEFRNTIGNGSGYRKLNHTGLINLDLAEDYANYRIKQKIESF